MDNDHAPTMQGPTNIDVVALLVELGARVEAGAVGTGVETPLHLAARSGRLDIVNRLVACQLPLAVRTKVRFTSKARGSATCCCIWPLVYSSMGFFHASCCLYIV